MKSITTVLTFALLFLSGTMKAQNLGGIAKTAKTTLKTGGSYNLKISSEEFADFKIVTPKDGNLTLSLESFSENTWFAIFNGDGKSFEPTKREIISGNNGSPFIDGGMKISFNREDKFVACGWNPTVEKFKGNYTFKLDAGTYYIRIFRGLKGLSTANLSIHLKGLNDREEPLPVSPKRPPAPKETVLMQVSADGGVWYGGARNCMFYLTKNEAYMLHKALTRTDLSEWTNTATGNTMDKALAFDKKLRLMLKGLNLTNEVLERVETGLFAKELDKMDNSSGKGFLRIISSNVQRGGLDHATRRYEYVERTQIKFSSGQFIPMSQLTAEDLKNFFFKGFNR